MQILSKNSFFGHAVSNNGVGEKKRPEKMNAVKHMKDPHNIKQLRAVSGLIGFYRKFFERFGKTAEPHY